MSLVAEVGPFRVSRCGLDHDTVTDTGSACQLARPLVQYWYCQTGSASDSTHTSDAKHCAPHWGLANAGGHVVMVT
jgi:hypothetical protein